MAPKVSTKDSFGARVRDLSERRGWSLATLAERIKIPKPTLYKMLRQPGWPRRGVDFYVTVAKQLDCTVADLIPQDVYAGLVRVEAAGEKDMRRFELREDKPQKFSYPMTDKTVSLESIGRIEHYVALLEDAGEVYRQRVAEIIGEYKREVADLRHELLKKIEHNDKGKKV